MNKLSAIGLSVGILAAFWAGGSMVGGLLTFAGFLS